MNNLVDKDGRIVVPGIYDDVAVLTTAEAKLYENIGMLCSIWLERLFGGISWLVDCYYYIYDWLNEVLIGWLCTNEVLIGWLCTNEVLFGWLCTNEVLICWLCTNEVLIGWLCTNEVLIGWLCTIEKCSRVYWYIT